MQQTQPTNVPQVPFVPPPALVPPPKVNPPAKPISGKPVVIPALVDKKNKGEAKGQVLF